MCLLEVKCIVCRGVCVCVCVILRLYCGLVDGCVCVDRFCVLLDIPLLLCCTVLDWVGLGCV